MLSWEINLKFSQFLILIKFEPTVPAAARNARLCRPLPHPFGRLKRTPQLGTLYNRPLVEKFSICFFCSGNLSMNSPAVCRCVASKYSASQELPSIREFQSIELPVGFNSKNLAKPG